MLTKHQKQIAQHKSANHRASNGGGEAGVTNLGVSNCPPQLGAEAMHGSISAVHELVTSTGQHSLQNIVISTDRGAVGLVRITPDQRLNNSAPGVLYAKNDLPLDPLFVPQALESRAINFSWEEFQRNSIVLDELLDLGIPSFEPGENQSLARPLSLHILI